MCAHELVEVLALDVLLHDVACAALGEGAVVFGDERMIKDAENVGLASEPGFCFVPLLRAGRGRYS